MKLLIDTIRTHRIIRQLRRELGEAKKKINDDWVWQRGLLMRKEIDILKQIIINKRFSECNPYEEEIEGYKSEIADLQKRIGRHYEEQQERDEKDKELLDIKDRYYKLLRAMEIPDKKGINNEK